jgi:ATP-dependent Clp protease ATP-binding subunit ClpA
LQQKQIRAITQLQIDELAARLLEQGLVLHVESSALDLICKEGFSSTQGARPLRRTIERLLTVPLSLQILLANIPQNGEVHVSVMDTKLEIDIRTSGQETDIPVNTEVEA